jgi:hypothetical protein
MQGSTTDFLFQVLSSLPLCKLILSTFRIPVEGFWCSLRLLLTTQMQDPVTQTPHPRCSRSLNMPLDLRPGPLKFLIIPRHQPFISIASKTCTTTWLSHWRNGKFQQLAKQSAKTKPLPTQNHPPVFLLLQTSPSKKKLLSLYFFNLL